MNMIHIMTHTHWDRDWFLTAEYTNEWLDDLFDKLFDLMEQVPDYGYILDGQTLILEDYLGRHPEKLSTIQRYTRAGNLLIGPYYGQIDWRAVSEESLMRNLYIGISDARKCGNLMPYGWMLDNFGYCSQSPQIHALFGIHNVFVWRGPVFPNDSIASEFTWEGSDGSQITAHYLMSGYRNFYNLTDTAEYIALRIQQLKDMLEPFAPHKCLLFLNGYDLDTWPEDPFQFLEEADEFVRSTPEHYATAVKNLQNPADMPVIQGELYSGKYACVFPGSLSARTYLKIENALLERILAYYLEPLQSMVKRAGIQTAISETESLWRDLIKTQLHDSLGGVSVDQVHDNMEATYRRVYTKAKALIAHYLSYIPALYDLQKGKYMFLPSPFEYKGLWIRGNSKNYLVRSTGTGFYKIEQEHAVADGGKEVAAYTWKNDFYVVEISMTGIRLNGNAVGELSLEKDAGDTYSADPKPFDKAPTVTITSLELLEAHEGYARIALARQVTHKDIVIKTDEEIFLNQTPVLEWKLSVDSRGAGYRLRFTYSTNDTHSQVWAKMPYDVYQRPRKDADYFGKDTPQALRPVLLAARETGSVTDFPFQGFVALSDGNQTKAVLAKGLREYKVDETGRISVTLKRSVEWLAKTNLGTRVGDAGPTLYVPSARDERRTQFELGLVNMNAPVRSIEFLKWYYLFEYGYLLFENTAFEGCQSAARTWHEPLPWSGMQNLEQGKSIIRVYNPFKEPFEFSELYTATDPFGQTRRDVSSVAQNHIEHLFYEPLANSVRETAPFPTDVELIGFPEWPVGKDHSTINDDRLYDLRNKVKALTQEQSEVKQRLSQLLQDVDELRYHRTKHAVLRLEREILEAEISVLLNELKRQENKAEIRERVRAIGRQLNLARRQRRTYDYILSLFENR